MGFRLQYLGKIPVPFILWMVPAMQDLEEEAQYCIASFDHTLTISSLGNQCQKVSVSLSWTVIREFLQRQCKDDLVSTRSD
jgi:hypothetical protein